MLHFSYFVDYDQKTIKNKKGITVSNDIITLDIETTSMHIENDIKMGFCYLWQLSINDTVYYGRKIEELPIFFSKIFYTDVKYIIFVHNLSFEFQFLRNAFEFKEVFARRSRHPIFARVENETLNVEFRCSLFLFNTSLEKLSKNYNLPVKKLIGDLDYTKIRHCETELTKNELQYAENDCLILYYAIKKELLTYKYVHKIPLTQTGKVRQLIAKQYKGDYNYYNKIKKMYPHNSHELYILQKSFMGGYVHANAFKAGKTYKNVFSFDIASSYPYAMLTGKFPCGMFQEIQKNDLEINSAYCYIFDITFFELETKIDNTFLSSSKSIENKNVTLDNGRIICSDETRIIVTDQDLEIIRRAYDYRHYNINHCYVAIGDRLPNKIRRVIAKLYNDKTILKGIEERADEYRLSKEYINSVYGMMVTNFITDHIIFDHEWKTEMLNDNMINDELTELLNNKKLTLNYAWGVWVTAIARKNLWDLILKIDENVIYCDTDSIKFLGEENIKFFNEYNENVLQTLKETEIELGLDVNYLIPRDIKNNMRPIGIFEQEETYDEFKTLGAKRYAHKINNKIGITVSGVTKTAASYIKNLDDFNFGLIFPAEISGKKLLTYNDDQDKTTLIDYNNTEYTYNDQYGICLEPISYEMKNGGSYQDYLTDIANRQAIAYLVKED